ncbi:MAG: protein O-mannosyl-transferase family [Anaerolineales bacterium]
MHQRLKNTLGIGRDNINIPTYALGLICFLFYAATTARDVLPADSGEFQLVAAGWGIAHPPGYPLYTMVGALWSRLLPWGAFFFRINLLSALLAAVTLGLTAEAVAMWAAAWGVHRRAARVGGLAAALALGSAATVWAQATIANIRVPTLLFTAWGFLALAKYRNATTSLQKHRALNSLTLALGLGVGHHPSLIFVAVGWLAYLLAVDARWLLQPRHWWRPALIAFGAWALPQLYLPLRGAMADVPLAPNNLATWRGFWHHVLARGFGGDMFAYAAAPDLAQRLPLLPSLFRLQFPPFWLIAMGWGWLWLLWRQRAAALALGLSWATHTLVAITYRAPQTVEYLMPAYVPMALTLGLSLATLLDAGASWPQRPRRALRWVAALSLLLLGLRWPLHARDLAALAADTSIRARVLPLLEAAPTNEEGEGEGEGEGDALILADWRWATPLWAIQTVEGRRPDVEVRYVAPEDESADYEKTWRRLATEAGDRPVLTTHAYAWPEWTFAPVGGGFRLYRRPLMTLPEELGFEPLAADFGALRLLGYRLAGEMRPGRRVEMHLAWQATGTQSPPPSFTGRLWTPEGASLAQADRFLDNFGDLAPGEVQITRLVLQLPIDRCAAAIQPTIGAYTVIDGAFQDLGAASLPAQAATCRFPTLPAENRRPGIAGARGPFLRGVDYDIHGDQATTYLHWCGPGPALHIQAGETNAQVASLGWSECQTIRLPTAPDRAGFVFTRADGAPTRLISLPWPAPTSGDRYQPFGDEMVLVGSDAITRGGRLTVDLIWRPARPLVDDYAISVRLLAADGEWVGVHDFQPGLSTLPTLKWVIAGPKLLDPHPFDSPGQPPEKIAVAVYERFRLTPLASSQGEVTLYPISPWP